MSKKRNKVFEVTDENINRILFVDDSDAEEDLFLDEEDLNFLEEDINFVQSNVEIEKVEVVIEPAASASSNDERHVHLQHSIEVDSSLHLHEEPTFHWKNTSQPLSMSDFQNNSENYEFGKILIETSNNLTAYEIFEKVSQFSSFLNDIVIPQTELYSHQKGQVFSTNIEEIKAVFGMHIVMGYHVLPSLRDYWSTESDLGVPYISNIMPLRRFEIIRSFVHFNDNEQMKPSADPDHDRAFKVRPVLNHFNKSFLAAMSPTMHQSIDEHMLKFKGHNILRQYVKGKPI